MSSVATMAREKSFSLFGSILRCKAGTQTKRPALGAVRLILDVQLRQHKLKRIAH